MKYIFYKFGADYKYQSLNNMDQDEQREVEIEEERKDEGQSEELDNERPNSDRQPVALQEVVPALDENDDFQMNEENAIEEEKREQLEFEQPINHEQQLSNKNEPVHQDNRNSPQQQEISQEQQRVDEQQAQQHQMEVQVPQQLQNNQGEGEKSLEEGECNQEPQQKQQCPPANSYQQTDRPIQSINALQHPIQTQLPQKQQLQKTENKLTQQHQVQQDSNIQHLNLVAHQSQNQLALATRLQEQHNANVIINASHLAYINKLQRKLLYSEQSLQFLSTQLQTLKQNNISIRGELTNSKQTIMDLRRKKLELEQQKNKLSKEVQRLQRDNNLQREKLEEVQKVGDVYLLKNTLDQLQLLAQSQRAEIQQLKQSTQQSNNNQDFSQYLNILSNYESQSADLRKCNSELKNQIDVFQSELMKLQQTKQQDYTKIKELEKENVQIRQQLQRSKQQISSWQKKWQNFQEQRSENKRARELQQKVIQYQSERHFGDETELPLIPSLSAREQKDILLRQYLILESRLNQKTNELQISQAKLRKLQREYRQKSASYIRKKQYNDLLIKYKKAKNCLQGAFTRIKQLQKQQPIQKQIIEQVQQILQGNQSHLCQNLIKSFNEHLEHLQQKVVEIQKTDELAKAQAENRELKLKIQQLEQSLDSNQKLLLLINEDNQIKTRLLQSRNQIIQELRASPSMLSSYQAQSHSAINVSEFKRIKELVAIYQTKSIVLIRQNQSLTGQLQHWKQLYDSIKQKLAQRIRNQLEEPVLQPVPQQSIQQTQTCRQCEIRKITSEVTYPALEQQTQTQNLTDLHYKEIKEMLTALKKVLRLVENIPELTQRTMKDLSEFKDKYEKMIERYNAKLLELKKERAQNDSWRSRAKEEIKDEFQDIRDLISNNRLVNALRQAKNLIDYLENQKQKGEQEKDENVRGDQMQQQHESIDKKLI